MFRETELACNDEYNVYELGVKRGTKHMFNTKLKAHAFTYSDLHS